MRLARAGFAGLLVALALTAATVVLPSAVFACSCVEQPPIAAIRGDPAREVLVGQVMTAGPTGVEVQVERWYQGRGDRFIRFGPDGFGDEGSACQIPLPRIGSRWIWIPYAGDGGELSVGLCTQQADLSEPPGAELLATVEAAFGGGNAPPTPPATDPTPPAPVDVVPVAAALAGVGLVGFVVFGGVAFLARRRRAP
jgi:hypothetical protein